MKSRAPLAMMEQMVMILVFALAATLCLQAFVQSDRMSRESEERDHAAALCQSAAEAIRYTGGDFEQASELLGGASFLREDGLTILYGYDWEPKEPVSPGAYEAGGYWLGVYRRETDVPGLGKAEVCVKHDRTLEDIVRIEVCWQEVNGNG